MSMWAIDMYPSPPGPEMVPIRWPWATVLPEVRSRSSVTWKTATPYLLPASTSIPPLPRSTHCTVPETGAKTGSPAVSPSTLAQSSEYLYWATPPRFVWVQVLYPWTTSHSPPVIGQAMPVLSSLVASWVGSGNVGRGAAVGTGVGTSPDGEFAAGAVSGAAAAAPSPTN